MSKATLRKELRGMSHEQLEQIVLDAYDVRPEIKEYFEFFINPDAEKLLAKYIEKAEKEIYKQKRRRYCGARVSVVRGLVKLITSYKPGPETVIDFMTAVLERFGVIDRSFYLTDTQERYLTTLVGQLLDYADQWQIYDVAATRLAAITESPLYRSPFKNLISEAARNRQS